MEREQEMLNSLTNYMEKYQNLKLQDINNMTLEEVDELIEALSDLREQTADLYEEMRAYEDLGEFNVDEVQDFYRKYYDFENEMERGFTSLGKRKTDIREYLADLLNEYREAQVEVIQLQSDIEKHDYEIAVCKDKITTMTLQE